MPLLQWCGPVSYGFSIEKRTIVIIFQSFLFSSWEGWEWEWPTLSLKKLNIHKQCVEFSHVSLNRHSRVRILDSLWMFIIYRCLTCSVGCEFRHVWIVPLCRSSKELIYASVYIVEKNKPTHFYALQECIELFTIFLSKRDQTGEFGASLKSFLLNVSKAFGVAVHCNFIL